MKIVHLRSIAAVPLSSKGSSKPRPAKAIVGPRQDSAARGEPDVNALCEFVCRSRGDDSKDNEKSERVAGRKEVGGREGRSRAEEEKLEIIQTCETRGVCTRRV